MFPGDPSAPPAMVYNCRCTMQTGNDIELEAEPHEMRVRDPITGRNIVVTEEGFEEWKQKNWGVTPKNVANPANDVIIKLPDIIIGRSLGAKAKNYDITLPNRETVQLTEGTRVTNVKVIAGKGRERKIDEISNLLNLYPSSVESEWRKMKGIGYVDYEGESYKAELHWYEEPSYGRVKWKVKPDAAGNWFIEDD